ncbi:MAG: hypothetical protein H7336_08245 [Bacteriovorax sp.]|nr:hypothetical protein [Bacteriovorax sp.]
MRVKAQAGENMKTIFEMFSKSKQEQPAKEASKISHDELREFLINNNLEGELLKSVTDLRAKYSDLTNYQAVEFLMDHLEN